MQGGREVQHSQEDLKLLFSAPGTQMIMGYGLHGDALKNTVKIPLDTGATQEGRHAI